DGIQVGEGRCGPVTKRIQQAFLSQEGGNAANPQKLTVVSDWGE
ncbi:hypothetical protein, partial [Salmonella enterica]